MKQFPCIAPIHVFNRLPTQSRAKEMEGRP
jgi:hypothetical protein